jgi:hypothetical protein
MPFIAVTILPRRRSGEERSDTPVLTDEQMHQGGTIRSFALDPGTRSIGFSGIEWTGMRTAPTNRPSITGVDTEPCMRVLLMELIDLETSFSDLKGHSVLSYAPDPFPGPIMEPDYTNDDMQNLFPPPPLPRKRKPAAPAGQGKRKIPKKDVAFKEDDDADDADEKVQRKRKRLKKLDGTALREDINGGDEKGERPLLVTIDLTEDGGAGQQAEEDRV